MELFEVQVETQASLTLPWEETIIMPISDIQYGSQGCDMDKFKRHMEWGMKHNAYYIGLGDMVDVASPTGRQKLADAHLYDSVLDALEEKAREHEDEFYKAVKGTEGRWLGLHEGHHYFQYQDGTTTDTSLAERLNAPFLGTCAITQIRFPRRGASSGSNSLQIWSHHGQGSGVTMTSPLNKLERMMSRFPSVDIFLLGHYSRKAAYPVDALVPVFGKINKLKAKRRILAVTGGFMKGYNVGSSRGGRAQGSYVEKAMMPPTNLGGIVLRVRPVHSHSEDRIDMNVEL